MTTSDQPAETPTRVPSPVIQPLLLAALGTLAVGVLTGRRDLIRGGAQLGVVQLSAAAATAAIHRLEAAHDDVIAPPPIVIEAMATWLAETLVNAAFHRLDPPIEHVAIPPNGAAIVEHR